MNGTDREASGTAAGGEAAARGPAAGDSLSRQALAENTASRSLEALGFDGLERLCQECAAPHAPDAAGASDPRGPLPIAYSEARLRRLDVEGCVVCEGRTCPAADWHELPGGDLAWLTPNLYPIVFPFEERGAPSPGEAGGTVGNGAARDGGRARMVPRGVHLVHWSSLRHDGGLVGADAATAAALFAQLARAEEWLLHHASERYPASGEGHRGHSGLIKNRGRTVGGSVEHDHQQLMLSATPFAEPPATRGLAASLRDAPRELVVDEVEGLALTVVPPFMRRPLHAFIVPAASAGWLHHFAEPVRDAVALAVARLTLATSALMAASGREPAWNLVCHAGEGCTPLFELRPYTQPLGGYEHLGLYVCEERPATSAGRLREALSDRPAPLAPAGPHA